MSPLRALVAALVLGLLLAAPARALPPALAWEAAPAPRHAVLAVTLDAGGARLVAARVVNEPAKLRPRAPSAGGLFYVVLDAQGRPLAACQSFDARRELFGDEPDPVTGELRSLTVVRDEVTFRLRVPLPDGARTLALLELAPGSEAPAVEDLLGAVAQPAPPWIGRGSLDLPAPGEPRP